MPTTTPTRAMRTWEKRVGPEAAEISKAHIQQLYHHIYPRAEGYHGGGKTTALTEAECRRIVRMIRERGVPLRVTDEQADQGRTWLARYGKRLGLPEHCWNVHINHFDFAGVRIRHDERRKDLGYPVATTPIYDAVFADGAVMRYTTGAWQSGDTDIAWRWIVPPEGE